MSMRALMAALSGLEASEKRFGVSANNVANLRSEGFTPSRTTNAEEPFGGVRVTISPQARSFASPGVNLVRETADTIGAIAEYRANLASATVAADTSGVIVRIGAPEG